MLEKASIALTGAVEVAAAAATAVVSGVLLFISEARFSMDWCRFRREEKSRLCRLVPRNDAAKRRNTLSCFYKKDVKVAVKLPCPFGII